MSDTPKANHRLADFEDATERGFIGDKVDPEPNESYTVAGVTSSDDAAKADNAAEEGKAPPKADKPDKGDK